MKIYGKCILAAVFSLSLLTACGGNTEPTEALQEETDLITEEVQTDTEQTTDTKQAETEQAAETEQSETEQTAETVQATETEQTSESETEQTEPYAAETEEIPVTDDDEIYENTSVQHIGVDSDCFMRINTADNPFKVSIDIIADKDVESSLRAMESGYSNTVSNESILGIVPEFYCVEDIEIEKVTINFYIDEKYVENTSGKYMSVSDEFVGIKRLNVFKYFEDINMLLPIETFHDVETNKVYTDVDELGTYCLMDMEIWFDMLGIEPD